MVRSTVVLARLLASRDACCCLPRDALAGCAASWRRSAWVSSLARCAAARASVTCLEGCFACFDEAIFRSLFLSVREPPRGEEEGRQYVAYPKRQYVARVVRQYVAARPFAKSKTALCRSSHRLVVLNCR